MARPPASTTSEPSTASAGPPDAPRDRPPGRWRPCVIAIALVVAVVGAGYALLWADGGIAPRVGAAVFALLALVAVAALASWATARLRGPRTAAADARCEADDVTAAERSARADALALDNARLDDEANQAPRERAEASRREEVESHARFVRGFAHDVKNPLGAADGQAALLEGNVLGELTDEQHAAVRRIRGSIASAADLIDEIVELARAEAGELSVHRVPLDLAGVVADTVEAHREAAEADAVELTLEVVDPIRSVLTDPTRVQQILGNLLTSAIERTPAGGRVTVRVRDAGARGAAASDGVVCVEVVDRGSAIPPDQLDAVFGRVIRLGGGGTGGLGLAIGRALARALDGELTAASEPDAGSTFTLRLPAHPSG